MNLNIALLLILGLSLGGLLAALTPPKTQRLVMIGMSVLIAAISVPQLWHNSTAWRVRNVPAFTTESERTTQKDLAEIKTTLQRVKRSYER